FFTPSQKFKILIIPNLLGLGKFYNLVSSKNVTIIKFAQSRYLIDLLRTILKI
ncbi:hypothetical protein MUK42_20896, partial [Musa troglodytarum]